LLLERPGYPSERHCRDRDTADREQSMYYVFAFVAAVVIIGIALALWTGRLGGFVRRQNRIHEELNSPQTPTLEYVVPTGQDPAVVLAALEGAGFTATNRRTPSDQRVLVACPEGLDRQRARVRAVIASAATTTTQQDGVPVQTDVRFTDEA
jgi:hypothetical protein